MTSRNDFAHRPGLRDPWPSAPGCRGTHRSRWALSRHLWDVVPHARYLLYATGPAATPGQISPAREDFDCISASRDCLDLLAIRVAHFPAGDAPNAKCQEWCGEPGAPGLLLATASGLGSASAARPRGRASWSQTCIDRQC